MSSLVTIVFGYIAILLFLCLFFHYKFLKILDVCTLFCLRQVPPKAAAAADYAAVAAAKPEMASASQQRPRTVWDIPGPAVLPLVGTKWIFLWKYSMTQLHKVYAEFARVYGSIVLEVTPSGVPIVLLFERADIEKVLRYPSRYPFRPPTEIVSMYRNSRPDRYASVGITNEQGLSWHHLRSRLTPAITSPRVLNAFLPALNEIGDDFVQLLRAKRCPRTQVVPDFLDVANLMGLEAVCTLMLGRRMGFLSAQPDRDVVALAAAVKRLFVTQRDSTYGMGMWRYMRTRTWRDFSESEELIYSIVSEMVDRAMAENQAEAAARVAAAAAGGTGVNTGGEAGDNVRSVFLSILNEPDLDIREKKSAIIDFISAGIETLANTMSFILYYISLEVRTQDAIHAEFKHCEQRPVDVDDLATAAYTKACVQETYRMTPTAFCLARILEEDTTLSGYELKAGTVVLCQTMHACNNDANFADAQQFRPARWLDRDSVTGSSAPPDGASLVVPYGIGRRTCPGRRFVEMELTLLLAKMVGQFEIGYCGELQTEFEFLLVPRAPVGLRLRDRAPTPGA